MPNNGIPYDPNKPFYRSKKWWAAAVGFAVPLVNYFFGLGVDPNVIWAVISPILVYVVSQAAVDTTH